MVADKIHARAKGKIVGLTAGRWPVDGRANGGGLRWGEMERDCGIAHGASAVLHERMVTSSDAYDAPLCKNCGLIGTVVANGLNESYCTNCEKKDIAEVQMPYAGKLLCKVGFFFVSQYVCLCFIYTNHIYFISYFTFLELMSMGVSPKIALHSDKK